MEKETVDKILRETEVGYDLVSEKFSQTRNRFWGGLEFIKKYSKNGGKVLDFGCGNGRLLEILENKNINYIGVDVSGELINLAENSNTSKEGLKSIQFVKISHDFEKLDFPNNFFDSVYSTAVFHHIPGKKMRIEKAEELYRVLRKDSHIVVTVWNLWPASFQQIFTKRGRQKKYFKIILKNWIDKIFRKSDLDWNDCIITFTNNEGKVFNRYHHAFTKNDLKKTFQRAGFRVEKIEKIDGNIVLIGKK